MHDLRGLLDDVADVIESTNEEERVVDDVVDVMDTERCPTSCAIVHRLRWCNGFFGGCRLEQRRRNKHGVATTNHWVYQPWDESILMVRLAPGQNHECNASFPSCRSTHGALTLLYDLLNQRIQLLKALLCHLGNLGHDLNADPVSKGVELGQQNVELSTKQILMTTLTYILRTHSRQRVKPPATNETHINTYHIEHKVEPL